MPLGDLQRREHSLLSLLLVTSLLLSTQYLWHLAGRGGRSAVRTVKTVIREIWDWHEWLDDLATSLENDAGHHTGEEEESSRMVIGLQDSQGKIVNGTEEQEYFASSVKPRRKRPAEASFITLQGKFSHPLHQILFRVGEIVFHRDYEVRGVVLGWDREAKVESPSVLTCLTENLSLGGRTVWFETSCGAFLT